MVEKGDLRGVPKVRELGTARVPGVAECLRPLLEFQQGDVAPHRFGDKDVPEVGLGMGLGPQLSGDHVFSCR